MAAGNMVWARVLEDGVFRFDASEAARAAAGPSLSFADPRRREAPRDGADTPAVVPAFEVAAEGAQKVVIKVRHGDARVYWPLVWESGWWLGGGDACLALVSSRFFVLID
jgi:alpha-glucosidase